jgi:DNA-binding MarR family transcriptional regulator
MAAGPASGRPGGGQVDGRLDEDRLDLDVLDAVAGLFAELIALGEQVAQDFEVPTFFMKAMHMIDGPLAMKELGRRMRCDPSFITGIADMLEKRGLATRESDPGDRRVKRLVLTPAGAELKQRMEQEILARAPWRSALSPDERSCLLTLIRKMAPPMSLASDDTPCPGEGVSRLLSTVRPAG